MTTEPKTWKSIDEQIDILAARGMGFEDVPAARKALSRIGYYRLSGYSHPFRKRDEDGAILDDFADGTQFSDILALLDFDKALRLLFLEAMETIELALQSQIAYIMGERDPLSYMMLDHLNSEFATKIDRNAELPRFDLWHEKHAKQRHANRNNPFILHHEGRDLPIWVSVEIWDFGMLSRFYAMMNLRDQQKLCQPFGVSKTRMLGDWLRAFNFLRNIAAHHARIWNVNVLERGGVPPAWTQLKALKNNEPFLYFCLAARMIKVLCPDSDWPNRFAEVLRGFPEPRNGQVSLGSFGVMEGWEEWPFLK